MTRRKRLNRLRHVEERRQARFEPRTIWRNPGARRWRVRDGSWRDIVLAPRWSLRQAARIEPGDPSMAAQFRHLALNADDVQRAKAFYESVFGWRFEPWGPPDYYQARNAAQGMIAALQHRRELKRGVRMAGFEATLAVDDLDAAMAAIEAAGGRLLSRPFYIETVGRLVYFEDPEGNLVGAMQYDAGELGRIAGAPA
jgi:hypothetical protein